jgi:cytochrome oxidase Cu insertion factor (SCO1/SenC/PrrC family)
MRLSLIIGLAASLFLGLAAENAAAGEDHGLGIGEKAPRFTLKDQNGKERSLDELLKKGNVALVFYRSASW